MKMGFFPEQSALLLAHADEERGGLVNADIKCFLFKAVDMAETVSLTVISS